MKHRTLTDAERIASIRECITAANGDWHQLTALYSILGDLDWLLARSETDAAFIAAARDAVPALLADLARAEAERDRLREALDRDLERQRAQQRARAALGPRRGPGERDGG